MKKVYLKDGDRVFCNGCYLIFRDGKFVLDGIEDDTYMEGEIVEGIDENGKPYIEKEM